MAGARVKVLGRGGMVYDVPQDPIHDQVCGSPGKALGYDRGAIGLRAGLHRIHIEALNTMSGGAPRLLWEGP